MFKLFALIFICIGIYLGMNYSDEIENIMDTDAFEQVQDTFEDSKKLVVENIDKIRD